MLSGRAHRSPASSSSTSTCRARTTARHWPRSKATRNCGRIPITVLTTSEAEEDILRTYDLGVNSFIVKPVTFEKLAATLQAVTDYWFQIVRLPPDHAYGAAP